MKTERSVFIGIDPGFNGAIAAYRPSDGNLRVYDMPLDYGNGGRRQIDLTHLRMVLESWKGLALLAVVEQVSAMTYVDKSGQRRGQGAAASFVFGRGYGQLEGVLAGLYIPTIAVRPGVWKGMLGLDSDKGKSIAAARRTFPAHTHYFELKKHDGRAEAALLAKLGDTL